MQVYRAPLRDQQFVLFELLDITARLADLGTGCDATRADIDALMNEAARFVQTVLLPLNQSGDREGCRLLSGVIVTPAGFPEAFRRYADAGWLGAPHRPEHGGQGLPNVLAFLLHEMLGSANLAFSDYVALSNFAYQLLRKHGSERLRAAYLEQLTTGRVAAAMCMTEAHCGSDIGLVRTRAEPSAGDTFALHGQKCFISGADHDLTHNKIYLVLARLPGAPAGTKGLTLFLVPKHLNGTAGDSGASNGVQVTGLEHKHGYSASATCGLSFAGAHGWIVGDAHQGMRAMFDMMNPLRLIVAGQGMFCSEAAYQSAATYARQRLQGRAPRGARFPDRYADPLLVHPDVRRILMAARAFTEGARALYLWAALTIDESESHHCRTRRREAAELLELVTPVLKSVMSDCGVATCGECLQVFGGHGYIRDTGVEQYLRDVRLAPIQEGANGVLALGMIVRELVRHRSDAYARLLKEICSTVTDLEAGAVGRWAQDLAAAVDALDDTTAWLTERARGDLDEAAVAGTDYLRLFGLVLFGWMWLRMAHVAAIKASATGDVYYTHKLSTARYFFERVLPMRRALTVVIRAGGAAVTRPGMDYFL